MLLVIGRINAQITTSLTVSQPSPTLSEWSANNSTIIYIADKSGAVGPQQVIIKTEIKTLDGEIVATKDLARSQVYTLAAGTRIFYAKDVAPLDVMTFAGSYQNSLIKTGQLPAGTYQLSVQLVEPGTFMPLTPVLSRTFNLTAPQLPYLIMPVNNDSLNAKAAETAIIFRWTPLIPQTQVQPYYRLQVFQILPFQQPLQALRGNQPVLDQLLRGQTQYIWRSQLPFATDTTARKFIWTVQTLNANQQPYIQTTGNGESRSEPFIFFIN